MAETGLLQDRAYRYLREQVLGGTLSYDVIYSESAFAKSLGCSRTPIKDALTRLSHAKYIDIIPSKGFMLHRLTENDILSTFQTRVAIESFCVISMMEKKDTREGKRAVAKLEELVEKMGRLSDGSDLPKFLKLDIAFHKSIVDFAENEDFSDLYEAHTYRIEKLASESLREDGRCDESYREHLAVVEAIRTGSVSACYQAVLAHNENTYTNDLRILRRDYDLAAPL